MKKYKGIFFLSCLSLLVVYNSCSVSGDEGKANVEVIILVCTGAAATFLWLMLILFIRKLRKVRCFFSDTTWDVCLLKQVMSHSCNFCGFVPWIPLTSWKRLTHVSCEIQTGRMNLASVYNFHISWQLGSAKIMSECTIWPQRRTECAPSAMKLWKDFCAFDLEQESEVTLNIFTS